MKEIMEKFDLVQLAVVIVTGVALVACVVTEQQEAVLALGGGLVGYLGGGAMASNGGSK